MKHKTRFSAFLLGTALLATPIGAEGLIQQEINQGWSFKQVRGNN